MLHTQNSQPLKVNIIPATKRHIHNNDQIRSNSALRIAAYCRVSTEERSQENSYAAQKNHYTMLISSNSSWQLSGIYADEGKSGTSRKKRTQFNQMITDAKAGKFDYIITKSISRFARNTAEALDCVHELQCLRPPVGIYFERENIDTLNTSSEIFLTFYCSMAQEESRSISENIKWSIQNNFRSGKPQINLRRMLGYDQCRNGSWIINEEQAQTVRYIYDRFLQGASANAIAKELNNEKIPTVNGGIWRADTIFTILRNEKYAGDLRMQKTYTESFLTHKAIKNKGEYPQYFLKDHHPAIIDRPIWNQAQELLSLKQHRSQKNSQKIATSIGEIEIYTGTTLNNTRHYGPSFSPFHGLSCAKCGAAMRRMIYTAPVCKKQPNPASRPLSYAVWKCPNSPGKSKKSQPERTCSTPTLPEKSLEQSFINLLYSIKNDLLANGEQAAILHDFQIVYNAIRRTELHSEYINQKLKLIEMQLSELENQYDQLLQQQKITDYSARISLGNKTFLDDPNNCINKTDLNNKCNNYMILAAGIKKKIDDKKQEKDHLINHYNLSDIMKNHFEAFLNTVKNLPDPSTLKADSEEIDTIPINTLSSSPIVNPYIIQKFVLKAESSGDQIRYSTTFGLQLTSSVNRQLFNNSHNNISNNVPNYN